MTEVNIQEIKVKYKNLYCHRKFSLRHPRYDLSATLRSLSEQPFDFTMHDTNGWRFDTMSGAFQADDSVAHTAF